MKIDRLLGMTVLLLGRGRVSAAELAERFEVSTKTIYRDMDTLCQAGIPVVAHQGTTGGFEIMEHYTMNRQLLTPDEVHSVVAAVKGIGTVLDDKAVASLLDKVQTLLNRSDKQVKAQQGEPLVFDFNPWGQGPGARVKVQMLRQAAEESRLVQFNYSNMNGDETQRVVEPSSLILKGPIWYLHGYCRLRGEFRLFRLSRMLEVQIQSETVPRREAPKLDRYEWNPNWTNAVEQEVVLLFSAVARHRVRDIFAPDTITVLPDGSLRVQGPYPVDEWFYGMILSFGEEVRVEEPASAAEEVLRRAEQIVKLYQKPDIQLSNFPGYNETIPKEKG